MMVFKERVAQYIAEHSLLRPADRVIVGLSGGADSVALLRVLRELGYSCVAAHCNFRLRGAESDRDQAFSEQLCRAMDVPFHTVSFDTSGHAARHGISIEMAARELRYAYFERLRVESCAACVAVAHHRDDSVETVLLNLIRGTGVHGLCGIHPRAHYIIRPLLGVSRRDVLAYLEGLRQAYVTDSTNLESVYTRNKIRLDLLPLMRTINPSVDDALWRMSQQLCEAADVFDAFMYERLSKLVRVQEGRTEMSVDALRTATAGRSLLYAWLHPYGFGRAVVEQIYAEMEGLPGARYVSGAYTVWRDRRMLVLTGEAASGGEDVRELSLGVPAVLGRYVLAYDLLPWRADDVVSREKSVVMLDADKLTFPLCVRHLRNGDRFVPFGMKGSKLVSDYLTDRKVPRDRRAGMWAVCSGDALVWLVGERIDGRYAVTRTTRRVARLSYTEASERR